MFKKPIYIKFLLYILTGIILFVLQGSILTASRIGIGLVPLIPFAIAVAIHEEPLPATIIAIYLGALCGTLSIFVSGYYMLILALMCSIFSVLSHSLLKPTLINSIIYSFIACFVIFSLGYVFMYVLRLEAESLTSLIMYILPIAFFSSLTSVLIYPLTKKIYTHFEKLDISK